MFIQRSTALKLISYISSLLLISVGCFSGEEEPTQPPTRYSGIQVQHQNSTQGIVEVLFEGTPILEVSPENRYAAVEVPTMPGALSFRSLGATAPYFRTEILELEPDRMYSFVLVRENSSDQVIDLTSLPDQDAGVGTHWLRFVNLSSLDGGTLYYNRMPLGNLPSDSTPSEFKSVMASPSAPLSLSDSDNIPLDTVEVSLSSRGASILIISDDPNAASNLAITHLPLSIEDVGFENPQMNIQE